MVITKAGKQLNRIWEGPALAVNVGDSTFTLGQGKPETTIIVHNTRIIRQLISQPSLTFGEAYVNGDLEVKGKLIHALEGFYRTEGKFGQQLLLKTLKGIGSLIPKKISVAQAKHNASHHYDVGNDFYKLWLDSTLAYTCAYYLRDDQTLEQAQRQKFDLVARKVRLEPGLRIIDLGCGWGSFLFHAAEQYGVHATGVVAAKEQGAYIQTEAKRRGLTDQVDVIIDDWRSATGTYDRVVSIGIMEHVGEQQHDEFLQLYRRLLKKDGLAFIHTIGRMLSREGNPWISKYIFPGNYIPTLSQISESAARAGFILTDVENLRQHYALTLAHWSQNFLKHRDEVVNMFDEQFARMWWLYLQGSEASFRWGKLQLWQAVLVKNEQSQWPLDREVHVGDPKNLKLAKKNQI
ncbi:class I SAM-dependent methyltransferase [Patescibacteria group bacterium]|nr:class I SAM-dependent methyltransferase [Patescibacteria group bacterium]